MVFAYSGETARFAAQIFALELLQPPDVGQVLLTAGGAFTRNHVVEGSNRKAAPGKNRTAFRGREALDAVWRMNEIKGKGALL